MIITKIEMYFKIFHEINVLRSISVFVISYSDPINRTYPFFFEKPLVNTLDMENMVTLWQHSYLVTFFKFVEAKAFLIF